MGLLHPKPIAITTEADMPGPAEVVWELITDWERQGDWMLEAREFVVTGPQREGVGVQARAKIRIGGISTTDEVRVVGWEPGRRLTVQHLGWVSGIGDVAITPAGPDRSHVTWREELRCPALGPFGRPGLLLFGPLLRRTFERDLRVLAELVRRRSGGEPPGADRTDG